MLNVSQGVKFFSIIYIHVAKCSKNCENMVKAPVGMQFPKGPAWTWTSEVGPGQGLQKYRRVKAGVNSSCCGGRGSSVPLPGERALTGDSLCI
jgi:hypothetical protein